MSGYTLILETSSRVGSLALAHDDMLLACESLTRSRRHNVELAVAIDTMLTEHDLAHHDLGTVMVSLGPGSFTGLRIGITTAQVLAETLSLICVGVPTMDAVLHRVPADVSDIAVCLNHKRGTAYAARFTRDHAGWHETVQRDLHPWDIIDSWNVPLIGELPEKMPEGAPQLTLLDIDPTPSAADTFAAGRLLKSDAFADPATMIPLYVREPEAVTLWDQRHPPSP